MPIPAGTVKVRWHKLGLEERGQFEDVLLGGCGWLRDEQPAERATIVESGHIAVRSGHTTGGAITVGIIVQGRRMEL
jgi:hypothetical protein